MSLPHDPVMLLSVVNTLLRDRYDSLDALCEEEALGRDGWLRSATAIGRTSTSSAKVGFLQEKIKDRRCFEEKSCVFAGIAVYGVVGQCDSGG